MHNAPGQPEYTVIPGDGVTVGARSYLSYMSVHSWTDPDWATNYAGLAYSDDKGENWAVSGLKWPNDGNGDMHQV